MSALPPKADIGTQSWNVRYVPKADIVLLTTSRVANVAASLIEMGLMVAQASR
jgi:hypothetical protein